MTTSNSPIQVNVWKIATAAPHDVSGLDAAIQRGDIDPLDIVAILGKTEGNGCTNDFTRGYAVSALQAYLAPYLLSKAENEDQDAQQQRRRRQPIAYVMSGGTEGVLSPHITVFTRRDTTTTGETAATAGNQNNNNHNTNTTKKRLTIGVHHTRDFAPSEVGTRTMVDVVAQGVHEAIQEAGITQTSDVHFVQIKCPLVRREDYEREGAATATAASPEDNLEPLTKKAKTGPPPTRAVDGYKSMALSRGASALGVALALDELTTAQQDSISNDTICQDYSLYSKVASTSAGSELRNCEIIVLGNAVAASSSQFVIGHDVMEHALDAPAITRAIQQAAAQIADEDDLQVINILCKAEASPTGQILNCRHTMLDDSDIAHTRMARAVVGAVVAAAVQTPMVYVSGGAEHQGPPGGGPVAAICKVSQTS